MFALEAKTMTTDQEEYPQNRRGSKRLNARIRILFGRAGTSVAIEAETDDISVDGVFVRTRRRPPDAGTKLGLLLKLEEPAQELILKGIVTRVTSHGMGIRFVDVDDEKRKVLTQALERTEEPSAPPHELGDGSA